jgi:hypothetical protein
MVLLQAMNSLKPNEAIVQIEKCNYSILWRCRNGKGYRDRFGNDA